jgi:hypothetical protein
LKKTFFFFLDLSVSKKVVEKSTYNQIGICIDFIYVYFYMDCEISTQYGSIQASYSVGIKNCNPIAENDPDIKCAELE